MRKAKLAGEGGERFFPRERKKASRLLCLQPSLPPQAAVWFQDPVSQCPQGLLGRGIQPWEWAGGFLESLRVKRAVFVLAGAKCIGQGCCRESVAETGAKSKLPAASVTFPTTYCNSCPWTLLNYLPLWLQRRGDTHLARCLLREEFIWQLFICECYMLPWPAHCSFSGKFPRIRRDGLRNH